MSRKYAITFEEVAVSAVQDLFEIVSAADAVTVLHSVVLSQSSDAGDAEDEQLSILFHRGSTSGSGGASATPAPLEVGDSAFGGTAETNNTTQSTEGTIVYADAMNVRAGLMYRPTPEERIVISPSGRLVIELQTAPADAITMSGVAIVEEIGG